MRRTAIVAPEELAIQLRKRALNDARGRNRIWSNLPRFLPLPFIKNANLPFELFNEPYASIDTLDRPEVVITRPAFLFKIDENSRVIIRVSEELHQIGGRRAGNKLQKTTTNISVVTVYDTYGIEIAYAYLRHLYYYKYDAAFRSWLEIYLLASLAVLQHSALEELNSSIDILYICSRIMLELMNLENKQPKMMGEMKEGMSLPPEIVAKITGSQRISEKIASEVRAVKCSVIPAMDELLVANDISNIETTWVESRYNSHSYRSSDWRLTQEGNVFVIASVLDEDEDPNSTIAQFSLYDYAAAFRTRGCNVNDSIEVMLRELSRMFSIVTEQNMGEVSAWIVQLINDTNSGRLGSLYGMKELGDEFQRLVAIALELRWS